MNVVSDFAFAHFAANSAPAYLPRISGRFTPQVTANWGDSAPRIDYSEAYACRTAFHTLSATSRPFEKS